MGLIDLASGRITGTFYDMLEQQFDQSWASLLGWKNFDSNQPSETYKMLGSVPKFREWLGGRDLTKQKVDSFTIKNKKWEQTLGFDTDDLRRDSTGQIMVRLGELAQAGAYHWEDLITSLVNTNGNCYDAQAFFATAHPVAESTTGSTTAKNLLTASEVAALDVTTATAPTAQEAAKIITGLVGYFYTYKNDMGHLLNRTAKNFLFMTSSVDVYSALGTAVSGDNLSVDVANPVRGLLNKGIKIAVELNPLLTSSAAVVYGFRTDGFVRPFILQQEFDPKITVIGEGTDHAFKYHEHLFGTEVNRNAGYGMWQHAVKATMS
jgi:phage major head subunit gpT-like protein